MKKIAALSVQLLLAGMMGWFFAYSVLSALISTVFHLVLTTPVRLMIAGLIGAGYLYAFRHGINTGFSFLEGDWIRKSGKSLVPIGLTICIGATGGLYFHFAAHLCGAGSLGTVITTAVGFVAYTIVGALITSRDPFIVRTSVTCPGT
jgi:hypothetical protein